LNYTTPRQLLDKIDDRVQHLRKKEQLPYHLPIAATSKELPVGLLYVAKMPDILSDELAAALRTHDAKDLLRRLVQHNRAYVQTDTIILERELATICIDLNPPSVQQIAVLSPIKEVLRRQHDATVRFRVKRNLWFIIICEATV
jgi:hypothetical protein